MKVPRINRRRARIVAAAVMGSLAVGRSFALGSTNFSAGILTGNMTNGSILEASGIAVSRANPNVLWTHNDSGDSARVFAMTPAGVNLGTYAVTGAGFSDWEDIAVGPGPTAGQQYLYIGDIGDNNSNKASVSVYRVPEPVVNDLQTAVSTSIGGMAKITLAYPNGPHDAESLFVDPLTRDIYIVSKRLSTKYVYRAAYPQATSGTTTMEQVAALANSVWITAADISPSGNEIIMRGDPTTSGLMYVRPVGGTIADAFATAPISIPIATEAQGEAIGFDPRGWGYYTTTEGGSAPIRYYDRLPAPGGVMYWDNDGVAAGSRESSGAGTGGTGTWNASAVKWYNGSAEVPWKDGNDAIFWGTAGTVTLGAAANVNSLSFKSNGYLVTGSTLTLSGSSVTVDSGVVATLDSTIAGSAGLTKSGAGTLNLDSSNTYSGGTIVNGGVLGIVSNAVGAAPTSAGINITINNGSTLRFNQTGLTLLANRHILLGSGGGIIDTNGNTNAIAGVISGSSLIKTGTGTLTLTAENTYTGATTVNAGKLVLAKPLVTSPSLSILNSAVVELPGGANNTIKTSSLTITSAAQLDISDNNVIVHDSGPIMLALVRHFAIEGRGGTDFGNAPWNGVGGIASFAASSAGGGDGVSLAVGYVENSFLPTLGLPSYTSFGGQTVDSESMLIRFTRGADCNLDGKVDTDDVTIVGALYSAAESGQWFLGDFDYDGLCDTDDVTVLGALYDATAPALGVAQLTAQYGGDFAAAFQAGRNLGTNVPEPASTAVVSGIVTGLALRRRRRGGRERTA